tara:strand:- start:316 stop:1836 length:1521 start_codon:yes stop_codon:yes gene_type:complete
METPVKPPLPTKNDQHAIISPTITSPTTTTKPPFPNENNPIPLTATPTVPPTTATTTPPPPWPTPLLEQLIDFEDPSTSNNDLTTVSDAYILNDVRTNNQLRLMCCTWNMHGEQAPSHANMQLLLNPGLHHLVMITTQECERTADKSILHPSKAAWEAALNVAFGDKYVLVRSHGLAAIHISLLCHRALVPLISHIDSVAIATGLGSRIKDKKTSSETEVGGGGLRLGNKGGVGISICIGSSSLLFVGAHLAAHKTKCDRRNQDFYDIDHGLLKQLSPLPQQHATMELQQDLKKEVTEENKENRKDNNKPNVEGKRLGISAVYDYVFWGGDFNYRINGTREAIDSLLEHSMHAVLYENDQLNIEMKRNAVFSNFQEGPLHFKPTYKFDPGTDVYDTSKKQRCPSWTDRILWRCNATSSLSYQPMVRNTEYNAIDQLKMSDHRPVRACFHVGLNVSPKRIGELGEEQNAAPAMGQQGHQHQQNSAEQPVGIAESLLGVAKSQVCVVQ